MYPQFYYVSEAYPRVTYRGVINGQPDVIRSMFDDPGVRPSTLHGVTIAGRAVVGRKPLGPAQSRTNLPLVSTTVAVICGPRFRRRSGTSDWHHRVSSHRRSSPPGPDSPPIKRPPAIGQASSPWYRHRLGCQIYWATPVSPPTLSPPPPPPAPRSACCAWCGPGEPIIAHALWFLTPPLEHDSMSFAPKGACTQR